jgi:hypothetical protein
LALLACTVTLAPAADSDAPLTWKQIGADARYVFTRPAHLDRSGWVKLGSVLGTGAALYVVRNDVRDRFVAVPPGAAEPILDDARLTSRAVVPLALASSFYLAGLARHSDREKESGIVVLESLAYAGAITVTAQYLLVTERPMNGDGVALATGGRGHSVSGDVTIAASMLAPVIDRYLRTAPTDSRSVRFWKRAGAGGMYVVVGLVAAQRVRGDSHWVPDVFLGYANGLCVGRLVVDSRRGGREWRDGGRPRRVTVTPAPGGVQFAW